MRVVSVYAPPRSREWSRARFGGFLEQVGRVLDECAPHPVIVAGDFNSHAREWGSRRTDPRGQDLLEWAATRGLFLINTGSVSTCVRPQGESIVDLTFGNRPAVRTVRGWRVATETDINSDHLLIEMSVVATSKEVLRRRREGAGSRPPRWALRRLDEDALKAIVLGRLRAWAPPVTEDLDPLALDNVVGTLFPTAGPEPLPYDGPPPGWESRLGVTEPELAAAAKRLGGKSKAPGPDGVPGRGESIVDLTFGNRPAVRTVRGWRVATETDIKSDHLLIEMSVVATSKEVLRRRREGAGSRPPRWALRRLDEDALKAIVLGRLRAWAPPVTEDLDPLALDNVVGTLFPTAGPEPLPYDGPPPGWESRLGVTEPELAAAAKRLGGKSKAPGPDGVPGRVWALALKELSPA
ncbi:uncharacterized protein LOC116850715 [Odontomachus brunneus]|uniref:uncharacterized protein LOC116850715 n=1 Tax=Odontomachus brunneus TaxID=486640 RepID=UPI0013F19259|nr:uncharacterized protein LOC116850715 [Odontomachus brunneus]